MQRESPELIGGLRAEGKIWSWLKSANIKDMILVLLAFLISESYSTFVNLWIKFHNISSSSIVPLTIYTFYAFTHENMGLLCSWPLGIPILCRIVADRARKLGSQGHKSFP